MWRLARGRGTLSRISIGPRPGGHLPEMGEGIDGNPVKATAVASTDFD